VIPGACNGKRVFTTGLIEATQTPTSDWHSPVPQDDRLTDGRAVVGVLDFDFSRPGVRLGLA